MISLGQYLAIKISNFRQAFSPELMIQLELKEGHGIAAIEAPRGTLSHEYEVDHQGILTYANIVTPKARFLSAVHEDITAYVQTLLNGDLSKERITPEAEKLIRSYDPCFFHSSYLVNVIWAC